MPLSHNHQLMDVNAQGVPCPEPTCTRFLPAPCKCQSSVNHSKWYTVCFNKAYGPRYRFWAPGVIPNGLPAPAQPLAAHTPPSSAPMPTVRAHVLVAMEAFVCIFQIQLTDTTSPTLSETSSASSSVFSGTKPLFHTITDPVSFLVDSTSGKFLLSWDEFQAWLENEECSHCIELRLVQTTKGLPQFDKKLGYVCSRHGTGTVKVYEKFPEQARSRTPKWTGHACALIVKQYPGTCQLLGLYKDVHNHPLKKDNTAFRCIPRVTCKYIAAKLRDSVRPDKITSATCWGLWRSKKQW
ncbi:hypothetical protein B0H14DRAFT_3460826 [Mycena olivaceomarginata]|nr:hypothetical protein B0H14DRAFT_3460826 [Mycena olivaceomarginata]